MTKNERPESYGMGGRDHGELVLSRRGDHFRLRVTSDCRRAGSESVNLEPWQLYRLRLAIDQMLDMDAPAPARPVVSEVVSINQPDDPK